MTNRIPQEFRERWNIPHCLGAIDGKHVTIECPANSESMDFNYKGSFSKWLLAVCYAQYRFIYVEVGHSGSESDGRDFLPLQSPKKNVLQGALGLPPVSTVGNEGPLPYFFVGDEAFPLKQYVMRPYARRSRDLLLRLGYISQFHDAARRKPIPDQLRATYKVAPIPRNMDPRLYQGLREARVEALERTYAHKNTTYYVDAANYDHANNKAVATVVDHTLTERTSTSVRCRNITDAEETAIALALALGYRQRRSLTVLTDSQAACRNYLQGRISQPALNVIMSVKCWNQQHGCTLMMAASEVHKHFHRECQYHITTCPRCSATVLCRDMGEHARASCNDHAAPQEMECEGKAGPRYGDRNPRRCQESSARTGAGNEGAAGASMWGKRHPSQQAK
ncbi:hypothetical protein MRX96_051082 [Rhipicephalus microplus]